MRISSQASGFVLLGLPKLPKLTFRFHSYVLVMNNGETGFSMFFVSLLIFRMKKVDSSSPLLHKGENSSMRTAYMYSFFNDKNF